LVEHQILSDLERIASNVKYEYPIELVTVVKAIDVIYLDDSSTGSDNLGD
jgi:hypothetical protein